MPGRTRLEIAETGPLDLIGAIASAEAVAGRDDFIVKTRELMVTLRPILQIHRG
jgi:hypothetical protein